MAELKIEKIDNIKAKAIFFIDAEEQQNYEKKTIEKYRQKKQIPGFRKGKAPEQMLRAKFGKDILADAFNALIDDNIQEIPKKSEHGVYALDTMEEPKKKGDKIQVDIIFYFAPYTVLGKMKDISLMEYPALIEEADIEKELTMLLRRHGKVEPVDADTPASKGDFLELELEFWVSDIPQGEPQKRNIVLGDYEFNREIEEKILEQQGKVGDEFSSETVVKKSSDSAGEQKVKQIVTIKKIFNVILPELTDEFVQERIDKDQNVEQLKEDIHKRLEREFAFRNKEHENSIAIQKLIANSTFYFPPDFIDEKVRLHLKNYNIEPDDVGEEELDHVRNSIENQQNTTLVYGRLIELAKEKQNISSTEDLFLEFLENKPDKHVGTYAKELYQRFKAGKKIEREEDYLLDDLLNEFHTSFVFDYFKALDLVKKGKPQKLSFFNVDE